MKLGLDNIRTLLTALGKPHEKYLKVQVAGTNGKGSVCAFLGSICREANIETGVFTSPHLISITERIRINGADISEQNFARHATNIRKTSEKLLADATLEYLPTFFEQVTAIALIAFAEAKVELAILETGLGGRLDATTAANAEIAAITRIDLDHQEYLGNTIVEIAAEKAAIIRADSVVVVAAQDKAAEKAIKGRCREVGVEPVWATSKIVIKADDDSAPYKIRWFNFKTEKMTYTNVEPLMLGQHQAENAAMAIAIAEILQDHGVHISEMDIWMGLTTAEHPGRLEYAGIFLFDGAHNPAGAKALHDYLDEFVDRPVTMVFAAMNGKNIAAMSEILFSKTDKLILTKADNPRSMSADDLSKLVPEDFDLENLVLTSSVEQALAVAQEINPENGLVLVTGSLYLVGEAKRILQSQI